MTQEVISIQSEALEAAYRGLTPSQSGFTQDLMASNTIIPVIDLTTSSGATTTPEFLQRAWDYTTNHTALDNTTTNATLTSTAGFYEIDANATFCTTGGAGTAKIELNDGAVDKIVWQVQAVDVGGNAMSTFPTFKTVIYVRSGYSLKASLSGTTVRFNISIRLIADNTGTLINPAGFTPQ